MKKQIFSLILAVALMATTTACGSKSSVDVLKEMEAANKAEAIVAELGKVAFSHTFYEADGTVLSDYVYQDEKQYTFENSYYAMVEASGEAYGYDKETNRAFCYLMVGDAYEQFKEENYPVVGYNYEGDSEKVISQETKDGIIKIESEITDREIINEAFTDTGYDASDVKRMLYSYEIDKKTLILKKLTTTMEYVDGTQKCRSIFERVDNPEPYVPDEQIKKAIFEGDMRTTTVTIDAGTDKEKVYTQTISKGNNIYIMLPPEYDTVYMDADCTIPYAPNDDLNADLNYYIKSKA